MKTNPHSTTRSLVLAALFLALAFVLPMITGHAIHKAACTNKKQPPPDLNPAGAVQLFSYSQLSYSQITAQRST